MDERESLVHPHAPKDSFAIWWRTFYKRSSFRTAILSLAVLLVFAFAALVGRLPKGIAFAPDFVKGFGSCYQVGMYYADPVRLPHLFKSLQPDAQACQGECAISIGCTHFTYWPDGGCLLTGPTSHLKAAPEAYARSITGPRECPEVEKLLPHAAEAAEAAEASAKVVDFSVDGAPVQPSVPRANPWSREARVLGQNGSSCSAYPTCAEDRLRGECCPNEEGVMLSCCKGPPLFVEEAAPGSACRSFKACMAMNLREGACCPSPAGIRMGSWCLAKGAVEH